MKPTHVAEDAFNRYANRNITPSPLAIVDTLRRQLERVITVEPSIGGYSVTLWHDEDATPIGAFEEEADALRHKETVIAGILQAARRSQETERKAA